MWSMKGDRKKCTDARIKTFSVPFHMQLSIALSKRGPRLQCARRKPLWRAMRHYTPRTFSVTSSSLCWLFLFLPLRLINIIPPSTSVRISCPFSIPAFLPVFQYEKICCLFSSVILSPLQCPLPLLPPFPHVWSHGLLNQSNHSSSTSPASTKTVCTQQSLKSCSLSITVLFFRKLSRQMIYQTNNVISDNLIW